MPYNLSQLTATPHPKPFRPIAPTAQFEGELFRMYTPIIQRWRDSATRMMAVYAIADMAAAEEEDSNTAAEIAALLLLIRWNEFFSKVESWHRSKWIADVARARGVDATFLVERPSYALNMNRAARRAEASIARRAGIEAASQASGMSAIDRAISDAVSANVGLIRSVSDEARARINNAVMGGMRRGASKDEVARQINKGLGMSRDRAKRIAVNQMDAAVTTLTRVRAEEAGIEKFQWQHNTPADRARIHHLNRNGKVFRWDDRSLSELPGILLGCRCRALPVVV